MDNTDVQQTERLCASLYQAGDEGERAQAHALLLPLTTSPARLSFLKQLLERSTQAHALVFASTASLKVLSQHWAQVSDAFKSDLKKFLLEYLATKGPELLIRAPQALTQIVRLLARVVRLGWLERPENQSICKEVSQFLQASTTHWMIGLEIYCELTQDMQPQLGPSMSRFRRTALSFRDSALPTIFNLALSTLHKMQRKELDVPDKAHERTLLKRVLTLCVSCLSYDFMGSIPDETTDDQQTVMVPHGWTMLRDENIPPLFFQLYNDCCAEQRFESSSLCLQCLVFLSSLRRSFFHNEDDRAKLLASLVTGATHILSNKTGLLDGRNFHELCRLLGKINTAHQLSELCAIEQFQSWIEQVYQFTFESVRSWRHMPNSKHYLLQFWAQMVTPLLYVNNSSQIHQALEQYIYQMTIAYIESRLHMADASESEDFEDPLEDEMMRTEQLEVLATLSRCRAWRVASYLLNIFDRITTAGQAACGSTAIFEKKLTWTVYMIASFIGGTANMKNQILGRCCSDEGNAIDTTSSAAEENESASLPVLTGDLASRVFQLISLTDNQASAPEELELSYLTFLEHFRKVYFGMHAKQPFQTEVTERLCSSLGLADGDAVIGLLINKIARNFQHRVHIETVLKKSLQLFYELASGISIVHTSPSSFAIGDRLGSLSCGPPLLIVSGRFLLKNDLMRSILQQQNHTQFAFLQIPKFGRHRTTYYFTLGKVLFMEQRDVSDHFEAFMEPFAHVFSRLWNPPSSPQSSSDLRREDLKQPLIGLARDLRGLSQAAMSGDSYTMLFDWLVNKPKQPTYCRLALFATAIDAWWDDPDVAIPILKFVSEFVHNKANRINFEATSPSGILLFKQVALILCTYGKRMATRNWDSLPSNAKGGMYCQRFKGIGVALEMLSHALQGNYTNFGVFEVYQDSALHDAFLTALHLGIQISSQDLSAYLKVLKPYYLFIEYATRDHMAKVAELCEIVSNNSQAIGGAESNMRQGGEVNALGRILLSIEEGLCSFEVSVAMQCCSTLDNIVTYLFTMLQKHHQAVRSKKKAAQGAHLSSESNMSTGLSPLEAFERALPPPQLALEDDDEVARVLRFLYPVEGDQLNNPQPLSPAAPRTIPFLLARLTNLLFDLIFSGEMTSTWSMSRPLLGLIILQPRVYDSVRTHFIAQHTQLRSEAAICEQVSGDAAPTDKMMLNSETRRTKMEGYFEDLLYGVEPSVAHKNKDHFTRSLYHFAQLMRSSS